ncbi:MAG: hypothetical protein LCH85_01875 [Chloroflexi bacterium]|nr:hypothetical protein [Chloroflexota bacterium]
MLLLLGIVLASQPSAAAEPPQGSPDDALHPLPLIAGTWGEELATGSYTERIAVAHGKRYALDKLNEVSRLMVWDRQQWTILVQDTAANQWSSLQTGDDGELYAIRTKIGTPTRWRIAAFNGTTWVDRTIDVPFSNPIRSFVAINPNTIYAIDHSQLLARWDGRRWTTTRISSDPATSLDRIDPCGNALYVTTTTGTTNATYAYSLDTATLSTLPNPIIMDACNETIQAGFWDDTVTIVRNGTTYRYQVYFTIDSRNRGLPIILEVALIGGQVYMSGGFTSVGDRQIIGSFVRWSPQSGRWWGMEPVRSWTDPVRNIHGFGHQLYMTTSGGSIRTWTETLPYKTYAAWLSQ